MTDNKVTITSLPELTTLSANDIVLAVQDPDTTPVVKRLKANTIGTFVTGTVANTLFSTLSANNISAANAVITDLSVSILNVDSTSVNTFTGLNVTVNALVVNNFSTPANSTIAILGGSVFLDNGYLYIATANNVVKRIALESF